MEENHQEVVNNLIAMIYTTASGEDSWQSLLARFSDLLDWDLQQDELESMLDQLRFHFEKAQEIQRKRDSLDSKYNALANTLDQLPLAIVIAHADGRVFQSNTHAQELLVDGHTLYTDKKGRLCLSGLSKQTKKLHRYIADTVLRHHDDAIRSMPVHYPDESSHMSITLVPTNHTSELIESKEHLVTIYISSISIRYKISQQWLERKYTMKPHEAQLAYTLVNNSENLTEAAAELGLSIQTVRSYLKTIFAKTNTHSQSALFKRLIKDAPFLYGVREGLNHNKNDTPLFNTHFLRLDDGRQMAYAEYGSAKGKPVLFFHSYIGSRLQVHPDHSLLKQAGILLIVPDRPGFGLSDPTERHTPEDYTRDIQALLDHLGIQRIPIIAFCIGATFAFACAKAFPGRIEKLVVVNPLGQVDGSHDLTGMLPLNRMILRTGMISPLLMRNLVSITFRDFSKQPDRLLKYLKYHMSEADLKTISDERILATLAACYHETLLQNSDALFKELLLCLSPWEVMLKGIDTRVDLIHGEACNHVPSRFGKRIADQLSNCISYYPERGGFYLVFEQWQEILQMSLRP